jgi:hypothetical protein
MSAYLNAILPTDSRWVQDIFPEVAVSHWAAVMQVTVPAMFAHDSGDGARSKPRSVRQAVMSLDLKFPGDLTGQILRHCRFKTLQRMNVLMTESNQLKAFPGLLRPGQRRTLRKAHLKELAERGENWALQELEDLRQAERVRNKAAYERFKAKRRPEVLRAKWRTAKAALWAAQAEAEAEAKRRQREIAESAAKASAVAAAAEDAERERKAQAEPATSATLRELEVIRAVANPRLILCAYWRDGQECRCLVNVGRNANFVRGMSLRLQEPADPIARSEPWPFAPNRLPKRRGRW